MVSVLGLGLLGSDDDEVVTCNFVCCLFVIFIPTCICLFFVPNPWTMYDFYPMKEVPCPKLTDPSIFSTTYNFHGEEYQVNQT